MTSLQKESEWKERLSNMCDSWDYNYDRLESFIENLLEEERQRMSEYVEKLKRTKKRLLGVDGVTDETHDAGINHAVEKVLSIINK